MKTKYKYGVAINCMLALLLLNFLSACGTFQGKPMSGVAIPSDTEVLIAITKSKQMKVMDAKGNELKSCNACTKNHEEKFGKACKDAPTEMNICNFSTQKQKSMSRSAIMTPSAAVLGYPCIGYYWDGTTWVGIPPGCTF